MKKEFWGRNMGFIRDQIEDLKEILDRKFFSYDGVEKCMLKISEHYFVLTEQAEDMNKEQVFEFVELGSMVVSHDLLDSEAFRKLCDENLMIVGLIDLCGRACDIVSEWETSVKIRPKTAELFLKHGKESFAANSLEFTGIAFYNLGDLEKAIKYRVESGGLAEKLQHYKSAGFSYDGVGQYYSEIGDLDSAIKYKEIAYDCFMVAAENLIQDMRHMLIRATKSLRTGADFAKAKKDYEKIADFLLKTEKPLLRLDRAREAAKNIDEAADYLYLQGKIEKALEQKQRALELYLQTGRKFKKFNIETQIEYLKTKLPKPL